MKKTARYDELVGDLENFLQADDNPVKTAEEQGSAESPAAEEGSDSEITKDMLPSGSTDRREGGGDITTEKGVPVGTPVPGQPDPSVDEEKKEETDPDTKVASANGESSRKVAFDTNDPFYSIIAELRGDESSEKVAEEAKTPADAASDSEVRKMTPGEGDSNKADSEDNSGNPPSETGAGTGSRPGNTVDDGGAGGSPDSAKDLGYDAGPKIAGLAPEDLDQLTNKVGQFLVDQNQAYEIANQVVDSMFGPPPSGQKTASADQDENLSDEQKIARFRLEGAINEKVAELAAQGLNKDQIIGHLQKIGMDEGMAMMAPEEEMVPEEAMMAEGGAPEGGAPDVDPEVIAGALKELVEEGEISPEEAVEAAEVIDQVLAGGGDLSAMAGEEAPAPEGGGESEESDDDSDDSDSDSDEDEQKEAALARGDFEFVRGQKIAGLLRKRVSQKVASKKEASAANPAVEILQNTKVATLRRLNATDESIEQFFNKLASLKAGGTAKVAQEGDPSIQDTFLAIDSLIESNLITPKQAADALESLNESGSQEKVAAILEVARAFDNVKAAMAEPMPPEAGSAAPPDPAAGGAPPAGDPAAAGGAPPAGDPGAAVEQLLGALEQLVGAGVVSEDQAIQVVQGLGLIPPGAGGAPPEGGAPPAPEAGPPAGAPPAGPPAGAPPAGPPM